ncbi:MAG: hypothetical protein LBJ62_01525 [Bifidobacteriaceae bacterium]|jgi:hypothetical protein|nr:hypothetical protein [Bifidobacteriaceae bacterium]
MTAGEAEWLVQIRSKLRRGNRVLFAKDNALFAELNDALAAASRKAAVLWALELAAAAVGTLAERYPGEERPAAALDASRAWAAGRVKMREARRAILDCHGFAKQIASPEDAALCHAVGQACGTVHANGHAIGFPVYELTAMVHRLGIENCQGAVEQRVAHYRRRLDYWSDHYGDHRGGWARFLEAGS